MGVGRAGGGLLAIAFVSVVPACGGSERSAGASPPACPTPEASAASAPAPPMSAGSGSATRKAPAGEPSARATSAPFRAAVVVLVPGVAIGPLRIGMTRAEVLALDVVHPHPRYELETTPYQVVYDEAGRVTRIGISLLGAPADVAIERTTIPRGARFSEVRELLGDCEAPAFGFGGGHALCHGGGVDVVGGSGSPNEAWLWIHGAP